MRRVALRFKWVVFWVWVGCIWTTCIFIESCCLKERSRILS